MVAFLFIGSGEVQPWASKHPVKSSVPEQMPLSGNDV